MKNFVGTRVQSNVYGEGVIKEIVNDSVMIISFPEAGEKRFRYPDAFCKSIQSEDLAIQEEAEGEWLKKVEAKNAEEQAKKASGQKTNQLTPEEIEKKTAELEKILSEINMNVEFTDKTKRFFIVHQGKTYSEERNNGYVWAPTSGIHHHERMTDIHKGDIIFNYANGAIQAVSEAVSDCFSSPRPSALSAYGWGSTGYRVQLRYNDITASVKLNTIQTSIISLRAKMYSSFDSTGNACQGYMYELEPEIADLIKDLILSSAQPSGVTKLLARI